MPDDTVLTRYIDLLAVVELQVLHYQTMYDRAQKGEATQQQLDDLTTLLATLECTRSQLWATHDTLLSAQHESW